MSVDWTKPIQTRDGRKARVLCTDLNNNYKNIVVAVTERIGFEVVFVFTEDGRFIRSNSSSSDIINVPEKRTVEGWVNVMSDGVLIFYTSKEMADNTQNFRIACVKVIGEYEL